MNRKVPNYKRIYSDLIDKKFPEKKYLLASFLKKEEISVLDVIDLNNKIFGSDASLKANQKLRSYTEKDVKKILEYQQQNNLSNVDLAYHYQLSPNTVAKWKKIYP